MLRGIVTNKHFLIKNFFLWPHLQRMEVPGLGVNWSFSRQPTPQPYMLGS